MAASLVLGVDGSIILLGFGLNYSAEGVGAKHSLRVLEKL